MPKTAHFLIRHQLGLALVLAILIGLAAWQALGLEFDFSFRTLFLSEPEDDLAREIDARFGDHAGSFLVAILRGPDVFRSDVIAAIVRWAGSTSASTAVVVPSAETSRRT